jgi:hypothetical protein
VNLKIRSKHSITAHADCAIGLWAKNQNAETDDRSGKFDGRIRDDLQIRRQYDVAAVREKTERP